MSPPPPPPVWMIREVLNAASERFSAPEIAMIVPLPQAVVAKIMTTGKP